MWVDGGSYTVYEYGSSVTNRFHRSSGSAGAKARKIGRKISSSQQSGLRQCTKIRCCDSWLYLRDISDVVFIYMPAPIATRTIIMMAASDALKMSTRDI
jgi:hypothetical protein